MIKISEIVLYIFLFFIISTGIFFIMANIAVSNENLDEKSQQDLANLNIYYENIHNPFESSELNYSLSDYSNTDEFAQSNIETKGALESIIDLFEENETTGMSALSAPLIFSVNMLPLPEGAFDWLTTQVIVYLGIIVFISFIAAWKAGLF